MGMHYRSACLLGALLTLLVAVSPLAAQAPDLGPGTYPQSFTHGGRDRTYLLHVPRGYDGRTPTPLVFLFHGGPGSPAGIESRVGFRTLPDEGGFIGVVPEGINGYWNDGGSQPLVPEIGNVDDVGFVAALTDHLAGRFRIDPLRIYATGLSNGGFLSNRLGVELSARLAAIAPVSGTLGRAIAPNFVPQNPVAVLYMHGTSDDIVPYGGGQVDNLGGDVISAAELVNLWVKADGCATPARAEQLPRVRRDTYTPCRAGTEVVFYTIEGGGHNWPQPMGVEAIQLIWDFFRAHPKAR